VATPRQHAPIRICNIDVCSPVIPRSVYPPSLAGIIEHLFDLANRIRTDETPASPNAQPPQRTRWLRRTANVRQRRNRPLDRSNTSSSDAPVIPSPVVGVVPNRDVPRINQANANEAYYPAIQRPSPRSRPLPALPEVVAPHAIPVQLPITEGLHPYYPEYSFLAENIPTRNYTELVQFFNHCRALITVQPTVHINHPLNRLRDITTDPLNFVNFLWRVQVTITLQGITERFSYIKRRVRNGHPDKAVLEPAFDVSFIWSSHHWTVTPVTPR
jgi:hypothetical protein